ncbi:hypothetical protein J4209_02770 [Candidatus Woesearchaeota archaeon]|nr:hypothetical protein [Candidatus Woesearchaeota archaeon]
MNKSIARIVIAALILLGIVILANEVNAALSCNVTDSCDFTTVFHMSNVTDAHAELKNNTDYDYKVCCWDTANRTIGTGCGYSSTNLLHLSDQTDAHAELANESDYNSNVCLNTTVGNITFAYSDVCTGYDTCLATVSTNITGKSTDLHVADCTTDPYATKVCVSLAQKGTISTDTSATPFYTTSANPQPPENASCLLDMKRGDKCNVTWAVVATGPIHSIWEFFATFTSLNYSGYVATQQSNNVNVTIAGDATPTINIPTISPSPAYTNNSLDCSWTVTDPDTASVTANITWYKNRTMNRTESVSCTAGSVCNTTDDITSNLTSKGNVWNCTVFAYDGNSSSTNNSVAITITNSIPTVANVTINSTDNLNRTNGTLTGSFGFSDADSIDSLQNNQTRWYNNSVEVAALNNLTIVGSGNLSEGQSWVLSVRVYDGEDWSSWVNSTSLTIANTAPNASNVVLNSTDNLNRTNGTLQGFWTFSDSDGDVQQDNETRWYNNSIEIPALVNLTTVGAGNTTKGENWVFSARVYDGEDWSEWINSSILKINNTLPTHTIPILNSSTGGNYTNESLTCYNQSVSDIDNDTVTLYYKWYNNNTLISSATKNTLGYNNFSKNDNITCEITPGDGEANGTALNSTKLIILNYQPVFNNTITNITWNENTNLINNLTLNNYFYDIDNDNLTYNVTGNSSIRVLINQTTSNVTFRPTTNWDGTEYIIFTATDGGYDTSSNNITLTVNHIEVCGDSICDGSETCTTCLTDCGSCGGGGEGEGEGPGEGEGEGPGEGEGEGPGEGEGEGPAAAPSSVSYSGGITQNILPCSNVTYTETEELPTITETKLDAKIPQGYSTVLEPFNLDCSGESVELTFSIPDDYIDVQLLKCKNQLCAPTIVHEITKLECGEIVKEVRRETRYLTPELMAIGITETNISISEFKKALRSGNNSVKFYGEIFENLTASLSMPSKEIEEAKNPALKITGTPLVLRLNNKVDLTTTITIPYIDENIFEKDSVAMYAKTEEGWDYLGGEIDEENRLVTANITNISTYLNKNNEATFALMGILCTYCVNSSLELIYEPKEKSRDAIILVHGLASSPVTYQQIIDDVRLTNQPFHLLTFGYPGSKSIKEAADEFSSLIEAKSAEFDNIYIVAHSLGGLITQQALYRSYNQSYSYIPKVRKVILVGVPNEGSPVIEVYKEVFGELINREDAQFSLFNLNGRMLDDVAKGIITPRVPTINYYVIAGTRNYALNLLFFKTSTERLFAT